MPTIISVASGKGAGLGKSMVCPVNLGLLFGPGKGIAFILVDMDIGGGQSPHTLRDVFIPPPLSTDFLLEPVNQS